MNIQQTEPGKGLLKPCLLLYWSSLWRFLALSLVIGLVLIPFIDVLSISEQETGVCCLILYLFVDICVIHKVGFRTKYSTFETYTSYSPIPGRSSPTFMLRVFCKFLIFFCFYSILAAFGDIVVAYILPRFLGISLYLLMHLLVNFLVFYVFVKNEWFLFGIRRLESE